MAKEDRIAFPGSAAERPSDATVRACLGNGRGILARRSGNIRVLNGDRVSVETTPCDLTKGRLAFRFT